MVQNKHKILNRPKRAILEHTIHLLFKFPVNPLSLVSGRRVRQCGRGTGGRVRLWRPNRAVSMLLRARRRGSCGFSVERGRHCDAAARSGEGAARRSPGRQPANSAPDDIAWDGLEFIFGGLHLVHYFQHLLALQELLVLCPILSALPSPAAAVRVAEAAAAQALQHRQGRHFQDSIRCISGGLNLCLYLDRLRLRSRRRSGVGYRLLCSQRFLDDLSGFQFRCRV